MRPKKYPLEPLRRLEKERAETKTRELGKAITATETAQRKRERAEAERASVRAHADALRHGEQAALDRGELRAGDLAQGGAWEQRISAEDQERTRNVERTVSMETDARSAEARAQENVAAARAKVEATARHEQRWRSAAKKSEEAREEEALTEALRPRGAR